MKIVKNRSSLGGNLEQNNLYRKIFTKAVNGNIIAPEVSLKKVV
jgi:hypothetical protein